MVPAIAAAVVLAVASVVVGAVVANGIGLMKEV